VYSANWARSGGSRKSKAASSVARVGTCEAEGVAVTVGTGGLGQDAVFVCPPPGPARRGRVADGALWIVARACAAAEDPSVTTRRADETSTAGGPGWVP
jgi:hypothetical protein